MALPINIEDLLNKRMVESNRIEFKASWNPDKTYYTFATDLENVGGGYILVGVEKENGVAKRPVKVWMKRRLTKSKESFLQKLVMLHPPLIPMMPAPISS